MAQSLLEKIRIGILSNAHALLDKMIDLNSPQAVRQYIRDAENSVEEMREAAAVAEGTRTTEERRLRELTVQINELDHSIDMILTDNNPANDKLAEAMEMRLVALRDQQKVQAEVAQDSAALDTQISTALSSLETKLQSMIAQLSVLETKARATEAKREVTRSIEQVNSVDFEGANRTVDSVADRIERQADIENARFERAMQGVTVNVEQDVLTSRAAANLEERKRRLMGGSTPAPAASSGDEEGDDAAQTEPPNRLSV